MHSSFAVLGLEPSIQLGPRVEPEGGKMVEWGGF
jgi:hypothetical protein